VTGLLLSVRILYKRFPGLDTLDWTTSFSSGFTGFSNSRRVSVSTFFGIDVVLVTFAFFLLLARVFKFCFSVFDVRYASYFADCFYSFIFLVFEVFLVDLFVV